MAIESDFFQILSQRLRNENNLSDITWALCLSSNNFRNLFLKFCFEEEIFDVEIFEREHSVDNSRADFHFSDKNGKKYLIEVKIYDRDNHFEKYEKTFPNVTKSFIANYQMPVRSGWKIKTWKSFSQLLETSIADTDFYRNEQKFIRGYVYYLNSVINILEAKQMNLSNVSSLRDFFDNIQKVIEECNVVALSLGKDKIDPDIYGKYVSYKNKENKYIYFWFGIYIPEITNVYFMIDHFNDENWCSQREVEIIKKMRPGKYADRIQVETNRLWIPLKYEYYEKLCSNISIDEQMNILKEFLAEILKKLK